MAAKQELGSWQYFAGVGLICGLTLVGCSKQEKEQPPAEEATQSTQKAAANMSCDDPVVIESLSNSIESAITAQVQEQIRNYAQQTGSSIDMSAANGAIGSILVDVGEPKALQQGNANSTQTCQANLSLTLPSEEIYRANQLYAAANGVSLQEMLAAQNIGLNNNMLIDDGFTYVVGEQAGEVLAKVVGQPSILRVVSDVVSKSQLQIVMDNKRNEEWAARRNSVSNSRIRPQQKRQTTSPSPEVQTPTTTDDDKTLAAPQWAENGNLEGQTKIIEKTVIGDADGSTHSKETVTSSGNSANKGSSASSTAETTESQATASKPAKLNQKKATQSAEKPAFSTPKNNDIEMVIIEEDTTY